MDYTLFDLSFSVNPDVWDALEDFIKDAAEGGCHAKWFYHEQDMRAFSKRFPGTLFVLHGEGTGTLWKKYFRDGKMQEARAVITYPEFDEKELR